MKKFAGLLLTLLLTAVCLGSCLVQGGAVTKPGTIFAPGSELYLIVERGNEAFDENTIWDKLLYNCDVTATLKGDDGQTYSNEIIVGNTSHPVSQAALSYLEKQNLDEDEAAYLFYVENCSLAIVYNDQIAAPFAIEYFYEHILTGNTLTLGESYRHMETFSISERKGELWEDRWSVYDGVISDDAILAMKALYGLFDEDTYMWIASLYDAEIGAFYFSESARDHVGFLPDVESTRQVLTFMERMGMTADFGGDLNKAVPKEISSKMVAFVKSLQDPSDGYFYHPQWGKDITVNRRGRDLTWSKYILNAFGASADYTLPDAPDADIDDMSAGASLAVTVPLGVKTCAAVEKVTSSVIGVAASDYADFSSEAAFIAWMNSLELETKSHSDGQIFSSQASVIKAKGFADAALNNLYERANPENGLWEDEISWSGIGGLLKLSSAIATLGGTLPYPEKSIESCVAALLSDEPQTSMTCVYNCVNGASNVMNSMRREGKGDQVKEIQASLRENAEALISACTGKILAYRNENGSFSYWEDRTGTHAQGALVSLGVDDGELNGTLLATGSITGLISIMSLPTVRVYSADDYEAFIYELLNAGEIVKNNPEPPEPYDFDSIASDSDDLPQQFSKSKTTGGSISIVEDPRDGAAGNVLQLTSKSQQKADYVAINIDRVSSAAANCYVLETDICYAEIGSSCNAEPVQIYLRGAESTAKSIYMLSINQKDGMLRFYDSSFGDSDGFKTDLGITVPASEWFNLRIEYYPNKDAEDVSDPRIKIIVTDSEGNKQERISTNYFGPRLGFGAEQPEPLSDYLYAFFYAVNAADLTLQLDNIYVDRIDQPYSEEGYDGIIGGGDSDSFFEILKTGNAVTENDGSVIDFESYDPNYGLIGWSKNTGFVTTVFSGTGIERFGVAEGEDGNYLSLEKTQKGGASVISFKAAEGEENANCRVFEADIFWEYSSLGSGIQLGMSNCEGYTMGSNFCAVLTTLTSKAEYTYFGSTIKAEEITAQSQKYAEGALSAIASGKSFNIRIEHYTDVGRARLYINGVLACDTADVGTEDYTHFILYATSGFIGTVNIDNALATRIVKAYDASETVGSDFNLD